MILHISQDTQAIHPDIYCPGVAPDMKQNATSGCLMLSCVSWQQQTRNTSNTILTSFYIAALIAIQAFI
jgi:hypothetical protein